MFWEIPRIWNNSDVYVLGGGKSLSTFNFNMLKGKNCVGCNDNYLLGPEIIEFVCFGDCNWFLKYHKDQLKKFEATVITNNNNDKISSWVKRCQKTDHRLTLAEDSLCWFQNTGIMAVELACKLGAKNVYLLGFDMKLTDAQANYYNNLKDKPNALLYPRFLKMFKLFEAQRKSMFPAVNIVNLTESSDLDLYVKKSRKEFFHE